MQELLRHANCKTTLDIYAQALTSAKREAQSKVVSMMVAGGSKNKQRSSTKFETAG